jgi:hypothetical protein
MVTLMASPLPLQHQMEPQLPHLEMAPRPMDTLLLKPSPPVINHRNTIITILYDLLRLALQAMVETGCNNTFITRYDLDACNGTRNDLYFETLGGLSVSEDPTALFSRFSSALSLQRLFYPTFERHCYTSSRRRPMTFSSFFESFRSHSMQHALEYLG